MKFKIVSAVLALSSIFTLPCFADGVIYPTGGTDCRIEVTYSDADKNDGEISAMSASETLSFEECMVEQCLAHNESVDVSDLKIKYEDISALCMDVAMKHPELLILTQFQMSITSDYTVLEIYPTYIFETKDASDKARELMNEKIQEYISVAEKFGDPVEKLLAVHDELVEECDYGDPNDPVSHHAYSIFAYENGVCQGYSQAFYMLAQALGTETEYCVDDNIGHSWNYVKLDGEWYHIDVTFDDPVYSNGKSCDFAYHSNFLCSDDAVHAGTGYKDSPDNWVTYLGEKITCSSKKYENNYLFNMDIPFNLKLSDGRLCAFCGEYYGKKYGNLHFEYDSLHINEPVVVSEIMNAGQYNYVTYMPIAEVDNPPSFIKTTRKANGSMTTRVMYANSEELKNGFNIGLNSAKSKETDKYMLIDLYEIKPLSKAVVID